MAAENNREKAITRTSLIGIGANVLLSAFKAAVGLLTGSIAVVLDAVNNLSDAVSSIITILGIKLSKRHPDENHPYGYGRIEYFSTIIIAFIILFAGVTSLIESGKKVIEPEMPDFSTAALIIIGASIVVKIVLGWYVKKKGQEYNSGALIASGTDASLDAVITAATLASAFITLFFGITLDGIVGAVISLVIIKAGIEMLLEAVAHVMGKRPDREITKEIRETVCEVPGVIGCYDLILHDYGPEQALGSVHVEIPASMSAREVHTITLRIQRKVYEKFHTMLTVGVYAVDPADTEIEKVVRETCASFDGVMNTHGIFVDHEESTVVFDVCVDFSVKDKSAFTEKVRASLKEALPDYNTKINLDTNYSD